MSNVSVFSKIIEKSSQIYDCPNTKVIQPSGIEEYSNRVLWLLENTDKQDTTSIVAVSWSPWAGKGGFIKELAYLVKISLKKKVKSQEWVIQLWDIDDSGTQFLYVTLDGFFKEIWKLRRTEMLRNMDNFIRMFSDDEKIMAFLEKYLDTYKWFDFDNVYLKRAEERVAGAALSTFRVLKREQDAKSVVLLDGLNSHKVADRLVDKRWQEALNIIKIMIFPRLERTFARLVKRDSINSNDGKTIKDVISFRLKELFYVFNTYTLPSLEQDDVHIFDFSRETDQSLTKEHMYEVIAALEESRDELLAEWLWDDFEEYIYDIVQHMMAYFHNMIMYHEYVTEEHEYEESQRRLAEKNRRSKEIKKRRKERQEWIDKK